MIDPAQLQFAAPPAPVWRIGRRPRPWDWVDWVFAAEESGTFTGRWDSPVPHSYRTIYAATDPQGALLEVLARFRPDPTVTAAMAGIIVDDPDEHLYPTITAGIVPDEWFSSRVMGRAQLAGEYCDVAHSRTIAALWPAFAPAAVRDFALADFDASALQNAQVRGLTQMISARLYAATNDDGTAAVDGIRFLSRFGADQELWTVFEQPDDAQRSRLLSDVQAFALSASDPAVRTAMHTLGLIGDAS